MLTVSAERIFKALRFTAKKDIRYYLDGVSIERHPSGKGALIISTDGHRMLVQYDRDATVPAGDNLILDVSDKGFLAALKKAVKSDGRVEVENNRATVSEKVRDAYQATWTGVKTCRIDATYPDWRRVIPKPENLVPGLQGAFNADYLGGLADPFAKYPGVYFFHVPAAPDKKGEYEGSVIARFTGDADAYAVVMSMRFETAGAHAEWLDVESVKEAA